MLNIINNKQQKDDIDRKREEIAKYLILKSADIKNGTISAISIDDLKLLFELYDRVFFQNWFKDNFKGKIKFSISGRMTKSAGKTLCPKNIDRIKQEDLVIEIRIGVDFFSHYGCIKGSNVVCGINTSNSLEALLLVFEHELCHVIEFIHFKKSSCSGNRFKTIAGNLFGHTESCHRLPTYRKIAKQKLGLRLGDTISFIFKGKRFTGILYNINKRATVMVRDKNGTMIDNKGIRYSKYYVPLSLLEQNK